MEQKVTSSATKGLIISLLLIIYSLVLQFLDLSRNKSLGSIGLLILAGGIIWSTMIQSKQLDGNVTFGNLFAHGFKVTATVTAIVVVFSVISLKFIFPEQADIALREARMDMESQNLSDDQIDQALSITKKFFIPFAIGGIVFIYLVVGVVGSLIGASIAKKNPRTPFDQQG